MLYTCILFQILILTANILVEAKVKNDRRRSVWSFWLRFGSLGLLYIVGHFLNLPIDEFVMFVIADIFIFLLSDNILDFISYKKGRKDIKKIMFHLPITIWRSSSEYLLFLQKVSAFSLTMLLTISLSVPSVSCLIPLLP